MVFPHSIVSLLFVLIVSGSEQCERREAIQGCRVDNGHAKCEAWDLPTSIHGLPTCTTNITFSLLANPQNISIQIYRYITLWNIDTGRLTRLQELSISANYGNHSHVRIAMNSPAVVKMMPNIKVLRLKVLSQWQAMTAANEGIYKHMKHLEVLD